MHETIIIPRTIAVCPECSTSLELSHGGIACRSELDGNRHQFDPAVWLPVEEAIYCWEMPLQGGSGVSRGDG